MRAAKDVQRLHFNRLVVLFCNVKLDKDKEIVDD